MILTGRGTIIVSSQADADAVAAGTATTYTFAKPSPVRPLAPTTATSAPPTAGADDESTPDRTSTPASTDRITVSPYHLHQCDKRGMNAILGTIGIQAVRNALKARCSNSGRELLRILHADRHTFMTDKGSSAVEKIMDKILEVGLTELNVTTFSILSDEYEGWNRAQLPALRVPDSTVAKRYTKMIRSSVGGIHGLRLDIDIRAQTAENNLEMTRECIHKLLGDINSDAVTLAALEGRALRFTDPKKKPPLRTPTDDSSKLPPAPLALTAVSGTGTGTARSRRQRTRRNARRHRPKAKPRSSPTALPTTLRTNRSK